MLILALGRCSPIEPSISKYSNPAGKAAIRVFFYDTSVVGVGNTSSSSQQSVSPSSPSYASSGQTMKQDLSVELGMDKLHELFTNGTLDVKIEAPFSPQYGQGIFQIKFRSDEDPNAYNEDQLSKLFKTDFKPKEGDVWTLSIRENVERDVIQFVDQRLVEITILLSDRPLAPYSEKAVAEGRI